MTDKKLTQLSAGSAIVDADLFYSAPQAGGQVKQPASALRTYLLGGSGIRTLLTADLNLYVATTGSDSNDGLTVGTPWLTIQHALNYVMSNIDAANLYNVNINVAAGSYSGGARLTGPVPGLALGITLITNGAVTIDANGTSTVYVFNGILNFSGSGTFTITNQSVGQVLAIWADQNGQVISFPSTTIAFGTFAGSNNLLLYANDTGFIVTEGPVSVSTTNFVAYVFAELNAIVATLGSITLVGTPAASTAGVVAQYSGSATIVTNPTGTLTGLKYLAQMNGTIEAFGATLPGTGFTKVTGGQFE